MKVNNKNKNHAIFHSLCFIDIVELGALHYELSHMDTIYLFFYFFKKKLDLELH